MTELLSSSSLKDVAFCDLQREIDATRRVLERLPGEHWAWKPHEKSMSLGRLATHVATLWQWFTTTIERDEMDFDSPPKIAQEYSSKEELLSEHEKHIAAVTNAMARMDDAAMFDNWTLRHGEQVLHTKPRAVILRVWCLNHLINHRAQLCLYLRLLDVPVPAVYFNSADEPEMVWE